MDLAWVAQERGGSPVWLHTTNLDHPNALPSYQKRGFALVEKTSRRVEVPDGWSPPRPR